jgi:hypothetical protein
MTATLTTGEKLTFRVGAPLSGHQFASVELTPDDFRHPGFWDWMREIVHLRMELVVS